MGMLFWKVSKIVIMVIMKVVSLTLHFYLEDTILNLGYSDS
jgi:hypothetical protein